MELRLNRYDCTERHTIGRLYLDGEYECWTLEDPIREVKVAGKTAIPAGRYRIVREDSPKFGPDTLTLLDVPGFTYIRIHAGNRVEDTEGCILVGDQRGDNEIYQSRQALQRLKRKFTEGYITIEEN